MQGGFFHKESALPLAAQIRFAACLINDYRLLPKLLNFSEGCGGKNQVSSLVIYTVLSKLFGIICRLTVGVTCVWAGVGSAWEQEKLEARKMLENAAESHTSGARFVSPHPFLHNNAV